MKKVVFSLFVGAQSLAALNAQSTNPSPYCYAGFKNIAMNSNDWINKVEIMGKLTNLTDGNAAEPHYTFYDNLAVPDLATGTNYTLILNCKVSAGVCGYAAWIDYNHNNIFEATERFAGIRASVGFPFVGPQINTTAVFSIPATALNGNTRMRIRLSEDDNYHQANPGAYELPCDSVASAWGGETEDYIVNITGGASTSINEAGLHYGLAIYPNPASEMLIMTTDIAANLKYNIYSMTGTKVATGKVEKSNSRIDISALTNGMYFIEAYDGEVLLGYQKFIKNR
jgi:hypothetical protein